MGSRRLAIRGGSGLGDALYVQAISRHLVGQGRELEVCTRWPQVFAPLEPSVTYSDFRRLNIDVLATYSLRRKIRDTDQFQDCCIQAGIEDPVELKLDWKPKHSALIDLLRGQRKPVIAVQLPRLPMDRKDGFGEDLLPDCRVIQKGIDRLNGDAFIVQIGAGEPLHRFDGIDLDLANKTTVPDLIDVASVVGGFLGYVSFIVPLAESLSKPSLLIWSRRGMNSHQPLVRRLVPKKVLHKPTSRAVIDDCSGSELNEAVDALLDQAGNRRTV